METTRPWRSLAAAGSLAVALALGASPAAGRTAEVHLLVNVDLQRLHPNGPPDEPLEPTPGIAERARELVQAQPAFRQVTLRVETGPAAPNPRVPADFVRLVDRGVDDVVVVDLDYRVRLDSFRASGKAAVQGQVAVHSVAARRKVLSRPFAVVVSYPGDVTKAAVVEAELAARARGQAVPVEEIELGLLDAAVKERLGRELGAALGAYNPGSLPALSQETVRDGLGRMAKFLAAAPDRRDDAILTIERYLQRYPDAPDRAALEQRLRTLKQAAGRGPGQKGGAAAEWAQVGISRSMTAKELADVFERMVGSKVELWSFKLDWNEDGVVMKTDKNQNFIVEDAPPRMRELDADPDPIYVLVVGRRPSPIFIDVKVPVVRWIGCPRTACPPGP